jgi:hypothetical protein
MLGISMSMSGSAAPVDPYKMLQGLQRIPVGGPWVGDGQSIYLGDGKNISLAYNSTDDSLNISGRIAFDADMVYAANNETQVAIRALQLYQGYNASRFDIIEADIGANDTRTEILERDLPANVTRITTLERTYSHLNTVAGGLLGANLSIPNIAMSDQIDGISYYNTSTDIFTDVGAEFQVVASQLINNSGGSTNTSGGYLIVAWTGYDAPG